MRDDENGLTVLDLLDNQIVQELSSGFIEARIGFVQQRDGRCLHPDSSDMRALSFTARKASHRCAGQVG